MCLVGLPKDTPDIAGSCSSASVEGGNMAPENGSELPIALGNGKVSWNFLLIATFRMTRLRPPSGGVLETFRWPQRPSLLGNANLLGPWR